MNKSQAFEKRIHEIDLIRGILIALVLFDHIMWLTKHYIFLDANMFFNWYWGSLLREAVRQICLASFCLLSGISASFSKDYRKRSLIMLGLWFIIMAGSRGISNIGLLNQKSIIDFNLIGVLAFSMFIYSLFQNRSIKVRYALLIFSFLMWWVVVPLLVKMSAPNHFFFPLWAGDGNTISIGQFGWKEIYADYLPLFPYMMFFFLGTILSYYLYKDKKSLVKKKGDWERGLCFMGRHSLIIYLAHQIVLIPIFVLINYLIYMV